MKNCPNFDAAHLRDCAFCRASLESRPPTDSCLGDAELIQAARTGADDDAADHLSRCAGCRQEVAALAEALDAQPDAVPARLKRSVLDLVPRTATGRIPRVPAPRHAPPRASTWAWVAGAAAAIVVAVLLLSSTSTESPAPPAVKKTLPNKEEPVIVREEPKPAPPEPRKEEPKVVVDSPLKPIFEPRTFPRKEEAPVVTPTPPEEPKPVPAPKKEELKKSEVEPVRYKAVVVAAVFGPVSKRSGGTVAKLAAGTPLARTDQVFTGARQPARLTVAKEVAITLEKSASLLLEQQEGGETRVTLSGTAFFEVEKRATPFVIRTPHAEAIVVGTSFQVETDEKRTTLFVLEGAVRLKNDKGESLVKASQRSTVKSGEKPSAPVRVDVEAETAWRTRPDLSGNPNKEPFLDHSPGGNRKLAGTVIESPYSETEIDSGKLAKATAELLDLGLAVGHFHRSREKKVWINIDRGTEGEFRPDGTLGAATVTDRAKKVTQEYLGHLKAAAGVPIDRPIPMIVNFRSHSEVQDGAELEICEVAWTGWNVKTLEQARVFYAQLLEKHKPAYRVEMRFDRVDETYDFKGKKRRFMFTESDAKSDGYMAPRHSQRAIAFFFNPSFGHRPDDVDAYSRILAELIEFLYARPR